MGLWRRVQQLLSGGSEKDTGLYFYTRVYKVQGRPSEEDEIVRIRLDSRNDLSLTEEGTFHVRKVVAGPKTFRRAELTLHFDARRRLVDHTVENGELVQRQDYEAYLEAQGESVAGSD